MTLVIEYVHEGHRRGYNFTSGEDGYEDSLLRAIWRSAMPRGQGWGAYTGSRSIKAFRLPDDLIGVADVVVTDETDETGRRGIRRATIDVMTPKIYDHQLKSRWLGYPSNVTAEANARHAALSKSLPRIKKNGTLVLTFPYVDPQDWQLAEATLLLLILEPPRAIKRLPEPVTFTTLALDTQKESQIVAMPVDRAVDLKDVTIVAI